ncbi:MAG: hypothetical protein MR298_06510 [Odoribacter sp.]|nr:hypothetical protein [Odoribacter sp.]MDY3033194.1 hypothetical protein [Odoribacter sp.]
MKKICIYIILCITYGCNAVVSKKDFSVKPVSLEKETVFSLNIDTCFLDSVPTSYVVESSIHAGKIYLLDKLFCTLNEFNLDGRFQKRYLGQGRANNETTIGRIATHAFVGNKLFLLDHSGGYHLYDENFYLERYFRLIYDNRWEYDRIYETPSAYTQRYNDIVCRSFNGNVFFNVHLAHLNYNFITTLEKHLERNANVQEIDLKEEDFGRLLAIGYPESYKSDSYMKAIFSSVVYDIDSFGNFYLTYEADSLVYVYDKDFKMKECYGLAGYDMKLDYIQTNTPQEVGRYYRKERNTKGFYNWLEYVDETKVLFRSYQKGIEKQTDGLQIYREGVLIGDLDVPKGLRVMGFIEPYYYSYILPNEDNGNLYFYRFKI